MFSSKSDMWATPQNFFDELNKEFNFTLDPCASHENAKCEKYFTEGDNGLIQDWSNNIVFCNPPYSIIKDWVKKCYEESRKENTTVVLLIPARTDTRYFHEFIYDEQTHEFRKGVSVRFVKGRLKFGEGKNSAPFPSMVVIFKDVK